MLNYHKILNSNNFFIFAKKKTSSPKDQHYSLMWVKIMETIQGTQVWSTSLNKNIQPKLNLKIVNYNILVVIIFLCTVEEFLASMTYQ